eukprot:CAMPEP_0195287898 /NCGR_PEP_ID=MMETSP0707-20130614/4777_1 /TAXON_ID=33640 /ORGANISM="Asterionellopsis glacialis, Strain CCMP134" /LENGTH=241 /DNA_ID=CAMNT_0040347703 /DNA_START=257 /DNA_END=982 /DNA_ORIENTATION=-
MVSATQRLGGETIVQQQQQQQSPKQHLHRQPHRHSYHTTPTMKMDLIEMASAELEKMRLHKDDLDAKYHSFPSACLSLLKALPGNGRCIDCNDHDPQWATVSYGALLCLNCSGRHRSLGVQVSCVRSVSMDNWSHAEVLAMLEGGNVQLQEFFQRHHLCPTTTTTIVDTQAHQKMIAEGKLLPSDNTNITNMRYKTKAAQFYRQQMALHVSKVLRSGEYKGREVSRRLRYRGLQERNSDVH